MTVEQHLRAMIADLVVRVAQLSADLDTAQEQVAALSATVDQWQRAKG